VGDGTGVAAGRSSPPHAESRKSRTTVRARREDFKDARF
jgi:hypothetical protein